MVLCPYRPEVVFRYATEVDDCCACSGRCEFLVDLISGAVNDFSSGNFYLDELDESEDIEK